MILFIHIFILTHTIITIYIDAYNLVKMSSIITDFKEHVQYVSPENQLY